MESTASRNSEQISFDVLNRAFKFDACSYPIMAS